MTVDTDAVAKPRAAGLRADATRNRERIINAAREAIVEFGPEVAMDDVARRAGVGNATLYRHFSDRTELIRQVVLAVVARTAQRAEDALVEEPDAFSALERFVFEAANERIGALCPMLSSEFDEADPAVEHQAHRMKRAVTAIMDRAQNSGQMRGDVAVGDLVLALTQLTRPIPGACCVDFGPLVRRHLQLLLDGLRAPARSTLEGTATTLEDLKGSHQTPDK